MSRSPSVRAYNREQRTKVLHDFVKKYGFETDELTPYQIRVERMVDFYPTSGKYFWISKQLWGDWNTADDIKHIFLEHLPRIENGESITSTAYTNKVAQEHLDTALRDNDPIVRVPTFDELIDALPAEIDNHYLYLVKGADNKYRADYSNALGTPLFFVEASTTSEAIIKLHEAYKKYRKAVSEKD